MVDSISKTDQVLVLLNRLAASSETVAGATAVSRPAASSESSHIHHARILNANGATVLLNHARQQPPDPAISRLSYHNWSSDVRRSSTAADHHTTSALEIVLGEQLEPVDLSRRLRCRALREPQTVRASETPVFQDQSDNAKKLLFLSGATMPDDSHWPTIK